MFLGAVIGLHGGNVSVLEEAASQESRSQTSSAQHVPAFERPTFVRKGGKWVFMQFPPQDYYDHPPTDNKSYLQTLLKSTGLKSEGMHAYERRRRQLAVRAFRLAGSGGFMERSHEAVERFYLAVAGREDGVDDRKIRRLHA